MHSLAQFPKKFFCEKSETWMTRTRYRLSGMAIALQQIAINDA
jgi:hypothetical protein